MILYESVLKKCFKCLDLKNNMECNCFFVHTSFCLVILNLYYNLNYLGSFVFIDIILSNKYHISKDYFKRIQSITK